MKTDVVIVGAGPTGLALACQFIRLGVDFIIIDGKETTTPFSKAIGVHARTLEIYEQIGLAQPLIEQGWVSEKVKMIVEGAVRGEINLTDIGKDMSPYPFVLIVEQGKHEKLLYDFIKSNGRDVWWQTELKNFTQNEAGVVVNFKNKAGESGAIEARYLVACDGAKSPVRHQLGLQFEGITFERMFYVADVEINWQYDHDALMVFLLRNNLLVFFPMVGENRWRIVGTFPEEFSKDEGDVLYDEIEAQIKKDAGLDFDITKVNWFSTYKVHTRHVENFSKGRCFLAGDSAHVHTPAGAQGMNTGIQDGYNLAWKLALVLNGKASEKILETYNNERLENAKRLLKTTDRMFNLVASPEPIMTYLRMHVFPYVAGAAFSFDAVKKLLFPIISQIGINYHHSSLNSTCGNFSVKAGDRMPYFTVDGASVYDRLHAAKFHLLIFSDGRNSAENLSEKINQKYADSVDFHTIPLYPNIAKLFGVKETFAVLLRPDNYIGLIASDASVETINTYLEQKIGG